MKGEGTHRMDARDYQEQIRRLSEENDKLRQANEALTLMVDNSRQVEAELLKSEAHYRLMTEHAPDVVWRLGSDYRFTYISPTDERLRGYRSDEVIGHHITEMFNEEGLAEVRKMAVQRQGGEQSGTQKGIITFEAQHRCKGGKWIWAEISYTSEYDSQGNITGFFGISREFTERKQAEVLLQQAKVAAEKASELKSEFLALVSHEIRTPLNSLVGFSTLARTATDPTKLAQYHEILEQSSHSLMDLVNDILDMSKIEAGRMEFESVPFNLRQLVDSLEGNYRHLTDHKMLTLEIVVDEKTPAWVRGDPVRLRQILANLLANAVKFTESGGITCTISLPGQSAGAITPLVRFEVHDTGIGIPENKLSQLFEPFRQLDPSISRKYGGSGLGLAIVHNLVVLMGGSIAVASRVGEGSSFVAELPLQECEPLSVALLPHPVSLPSGTVLVVEDNRFNRLLLEHVLTDWGQQITLAEDGHQALQFIEQQRFDLILLDIRMPDIDGIEVARRIRRRELDRAESPVPIIALTADLETATRDACLDVGINVVLPKPVNREQLARAIAAHRGGMGEMAPGRYPLLNLQTSKGLGNDPDRVLQYQELLAEDIDEELHSLQGALEHADRDLLCRSAHTLKGLCGQLANQAPLELAIWLQQNAPSASSEQLGQVIEQLIAFNLSRLIQEKTP